ncbi:hypothetical protein SAMN04487905_11729 [Actinopolyspora xinjiangensis]|uniref:Uncharacterized protein n=1 Tax=Actinopolyspora xinjiangensis TaxID=405564 RepID=A0A1H0WXN9_9ACTN|nr:hypothetical protein SAMN04487905_11729 [Actinopolyspora xinjiangensis]
MPSAVWVASRKPLTPRRKDRPTCSAVRFRYEVSGPAWEPRGRDRAQAALIPVVVLSVFDDR